MGYLNSSRALAFGQKFGSHPTSRAVSTSPCAQVKPESRQNKSKAATFLLRGEGNGKAELGALCKALSAVLEANSIEHRIELYDGTDTLRREFIYPPVA
jgi:hypothetical protein